MVSNSYGLSSRGAQRRRICICSSSVGLFSPQVPAVPRFLGPGRKTRSTPDRGRLVGYAHLTPRKPGFDQLKHLDVTICRLFPLIR
jgi:hypothetical protein